MAQYRSTAAVLQFVLLPAIWNKVFAIDCFECFSFNKSNVHCGDPFHPAYGTLTRDCTQTKDGRIGDFPAKFCIKLIGKTAKDDIEMVYRGCSIESLDSQCSDFTFEDVRYYGCVMSCQDDGCNNSTHAQTSISSLALALFVALLKNMTFIFDIV